jgi:antitoxin (DNA-binding transcriptional repressor) of toxin-antitoxin stability system
MVMGKTVGIAEFKAKCERLISQMEKDGIAIELTRRGKVVGVLSPPKSASTKPLPSAFGMLKSDRYRYDADPTEPAVDPAEWDRNNPAGLYRRS